MKGLQSIDNNIMFEDMINEIVTNLAIEMIKINNTYITPLKKQNHHHTIKNKLSSVNTAIDEYEKLIAKYELGREMKNEIEELFWDNYVKLLQMQIKLADEYKIQNNHIQQGRMKEVNEF
ncbi:MAG: hypothetical protein QXG00_03400 [Candidatus Woesearchaeota archaeon]